jgi:hypothetical protein
MTAKPLWYSCDFFMGLLVIENICNPYTNFKLDMS